MTAAPLSPAPTPWSAWGERLVAAGNGELMSVVNGTITSKPGWRSARTRKPSRATGGAMEQTAEPADLTTAIPSPPSATPAARPSRRRDAPRNRRPVQAPQLIEAARLADQLQAAGFTERDIARIIDRDPSLVSQFYTRHKGAAFVPALTRVLQAVQTAGITDTTELAAIAAPHITRRTTSSGTRARVRTRSVLITPAGTGTGRAGAQAIASGSTRLRALIAEAARQRLRLAFTVRLAKTAYVHPSGSRTDSPGIRRDVIQRADHTEERSYGSSATGGFDATDFARRTDRAAGDVTVAIHQWLVETGRIHPDARIIHLEIRTWRPRS
ncbi:helix-turn-helix domain containing protein [Streptomyces sp. NPDC006368]|uniref:helix-turn-helix domain containing protein n=1 Tax=Streptomyces sp. NPDC006368 TaxID=3156760 RepID=UPI0033B95836